MAFSRAISRAPTASTVVVTTGMPMGTTDVKMTKTVTMEKPGGWLYRPIMTPRMMAQPASANSASAMDTRFST